MKKLPLLPVRYAPVLFALLMSMVMAFIMTALITLINTGFDSKFHLRWSLTFVIAWPLAFICVLIFSGKVRHVVGLLTETALPPETMIMAHGIAAETKALK